MALTLYACNKESLDMVVEAKSYTWNRELYHITPSYKYVNNVRISAEPLEQFVSYDTVRLSSQQAQQQQDSLFQASKGKYIYRFKRISVE